MDNKREIEDAYSLAYSSYYENNEYASRIRMGMSNLLNGSDLSIDFLEVR